MVNDDNDDEVLDSEPTSTDTLLLRSGAALDADGVAAIGSARSFHLIVLAGEPGSGKTTLIASIYEQFLSGPLDEFTFAGSQTLVGFELRCHESRVDSGLSLPDTE